MVAPLGTPPPSTNLSEQPQPSSSSSISNSNIGAQQQQQQQQQMPKLSRSATSRRNFGHNERMELVLATFFFDRPIDLKNYLKSLNPFKS